MQLSKILSTSGRILCDVPGPRHVRSDPRRMRGRTTPRDTNARVCHTPQLGAISCQRVRPINSSQHNGGMVPVSRDRCLPTQRNVRGRSSDSRRIRGEVKAHLTSTPTCYMSHSAVAPSWCGFHNVATSTAGCSVHSCFVEASDRHAHSTDVPNCPTGLHPVLACEQPLSIGALATHVSTVDHGMAPSVA